MQIRTATADHAADIAALHLETLPAAVSDFTPLGRLVVERFYRNLMARGLGTVFVVEDGSALAGFVLATEDVRRLFRDALIGGADDMLHLVTHVTPWALARAALRQLPTVRCEAPHRAEIVYLAVGDRYRRGGCAGTLMRAASNHLRTRGAAVCQAHVDRDNESAIVFNFCMGFTLLPEPFGPGGRRHTMVKRLRGA